MEEQVSLAPDWDKFAEWEEERKRKQDKEMYLFALEILELFDTSGMDEPQ